MVGWTQWGHRMKWALPVAVDALALVAGLVWLADRMSDEDRTITLAAVAGSLGLNALGQLVESARRGASGTFSPACAEPDVAKPMRAPARVVLPCGRWRASAS